MSSNLTQRRPVTSSQPATLQPLPGSSDTRPAVPRKVINTLLLFTLAMIVLPIGSYFVLLGPVFKGNSTYAGGFAALMANVVLIGYVVVAFLEDSGEEKKHVGPGVVSVGTEGDAKKAQ